MTNVDKMRLKFNEIELKVNRMGLGFNRIKLRFRLKETESL